MYFSLPRGIANAAGFFLAWFIVEAIVHLILWFFLMKYLQPYHRHPLNKSLGYAVGFVQACAVYLFFISFIFAFPVRGQIKQAILDSKSGPFFVSVSQRFESSIKGVFGDAISDTLNFLTVKPHSNESLSLGFYQPVSQTRSDPSSEQIMLDLVNKERTSRGIKPLKFDPELVPVARSYGEEMFAHGFFSHTSQVDGSTPGDRASRAGVVYLVLGENLAFAPDVYIAHQGLMNSEGHRKNILSEDYGRVGIGVIDGGVYGKMFVQEFRN